MQLTRSSSDASMRSTSSKGSDGDSSTPIFVKLLSGETISLSLPPSTTVPTLLQLLSLRTALPPSSLRLIYSSRHLPPSASLSSLPANATLTLATPILGGMPPKKLRCGFKECKERAQPIVGDCGFCEGHYCGKHRMLEDHKCSGLEDCKKESYERNKVQLESERTVALRGM